MPRFFDHKHILDFLENQGSDARKESRVQGFDLTVDFHKCQVFGKDQDGRHQAASREKIGFSKMRGIIIVILVWKIRRSVF